LSRGLLKKSAILILANEEERITTDHTEKNTDYGGSKEAKSVQFS
jgi:hypothetical protein